MLDGLTIDQLRVFLAAAEERSFSAAGRRLRRAQSAISHAVAALEDQLGVVLFDRSARYPVLTDAGHALLASARRVVGNVDELKAQARGLADGLEAELAIVVDVMFPLEDLTAAVSAFRDAFPTVPLCLYVEALGAVAKPVMSGECRLGIIGSLPVVPEQLGKLPLGAVKLTPVVSPDHPLADRKEPISARELSDHVQLVLSDRTELTKGQDFAVLSPQTWRLADLGAKHAFLKAGLGWGNMPLPMIQEDLDNRSLVELTLEDQLPAGGHLPMFVVFRKDTPPGPASRWFIEQLKAPKRAPPIDFRSE